MRSARRFSRFAGADPDAEGREAVLLARAIDRAKDHDVDALRFLYVRFADQVYGYVLSIVRDTHEAQDVTQNVFAQLFRKIQHYEPREVPFAGWILRVARNAAFDHVRSRRSIPCEEVRTDEEGTDGGFELAQSLRDALRRISPDQREVLVLRHIAGLSPAEIASRLNKSESSIHGLHHRGRGALKAALVELDAAPVTASA